VQPHLVRRGFSWCERWYRGPSRQPTYTCVLLGLLMPAFPDQALEDPDNGEGQNDQQYKLYDEIRGMKVEWHDHKIALLGAASMSVAIQSPARRFCSDPLGHGAVPLP